MDPLVRAKAQWALFRGTDWNQQDLGDQVLYVGEVFADGSGRIRVMDLLYRPPLGAGPVASMIAPITLTSSMIILVWFICAIWVFITFVWPNWKAAPPRDPTDAFWRIRRLFFAALALIAAPFLVIYQVGRATVMWLVKRWSKIQPTVLQRANP
jgi:small-conductance mechanosensitive channel